MDTLTAILLAVVVLSIGVIIGAKDERSTVASECERLGAFYVGDKVFECKLKGK